MLTPTQEQQPERDSEQVPESPTQRRQYALVELAGHLLALDVSHTTEVVERPAITPVPNTPGFILGVCNVRGDIYSIVDVRDLLGLESVERDARADPLVILVQGKRYACGIAIEGISELVWIRNEEIARLTSEVPFVSGLYRSNQAAVLVLDIEELLASSEMTQFQ